MKANLWKLGFILGAGLFLAGCATSSGKNAASGSAELPDEETAFVSTTLPLAAKLRFEDLPVPAGFKMLPAQSYVFQTEGVRVALLRYAGRAELEDLIKFYQEQMFNCNWELINLVQYDKSILNFTRSEQSCIITIEPQGGKKKLVTVSVAPKSKKALDTPKQK